LKQPEKRFKNAASSLPSLAMYSSFMSPTLRVAKLDNHRTPQQIGQGRFSLL